MSEKKRKFVNLSAAGRICRRFGMKNITSSQVFSHMDKIHQWTRLDSANLSRIADALEDLAKSLHRRK